MRTNGNRRVLVAEDDDGIRTMLRVLLVRSGFVVDCVPDGAQALELLARSSYHALVLDLIMPQVSGFAVLERLESERPLLLQRTIIITGVADRLLSVVDQRKTFAVVRKPFDISTLVATITRCGDRAADADEGIAPSESLDHGPRRFASSATELRRMLASPDMPRVELIPVSPKRHGAGVKTPHPQSPPFHSYMSERFGADQCPPRDMSAAFSFIDPDVK